MGRSIGNLFHREASAAKIKECAGFHAGRWVWSATLRTAPERLALAG